LNPNKNFERGSDLPFGLINFATAVFKIPTKRIYVVKERFKLNLPLSSAYGSILFCFCDILHKHRDATAMGCLVHTVQLRVLHATVYCM
jgi:hypothetical protein